MPAFATEGNFNNDIGVPLTLLRLREGCRAAVVELGMNHAGEIARLAQIAAPTIALVNNAQREHLEFMATVDAVARENGSAIAALGDDGVAVFPADDAHAAIWREIAGARRTITFALHEAADVSGSARLARRPLDRGDADAGRRGDLHAAPRRHAQRPQRAGGERGGTRRGRLARGDRARPGSFVAVRGPLAGEALRARRRRASR